MRASSEGVIEGIGEALFCWILYLFLGGLVNFALEIFSTYKPFGNLCLFVMKGQR